MFGWCIAKGATIYEVMLTGRRLYRMGWYRMRHGVAMALARGFIAHRDERRSTLICVRYSSMVGGAVTSHQVKWAGRFNGSWIWHGSLTHSSFFASVGWRINIGIEEKSRNCQEIKDSPWRENGTGVEAERWSKIAFCGNFGTFVS